MPFTSIRYESWSAIAFASPKAERFASYPSGIANSSMRADLKMNFTQMATLFLWRHSPVPTLSFDQYGPR